MHWAMCAVFLLRPVFNHDDDLHHNQISVKLRKHYFSCPVVFSCAEILISIFPFSFSFFISEPNQSREEESQCTVGGLRVVLGGAGVSGQDFVVHSLVNPDPSSNH